jgi:hypothetical protein
MFEKEDISEQRCQWIFARRSTYMSPRETQYAYCDGNFASNMRIAKRDTHIATENLPPRRASTRDTQKSAFSDKISTTTQTPRFYSQPVLIAFADRLDVLSAQDEALHRRRSMSSYRKGRGASLAIVGLKGGMSQG